MNSPTESTLPPSVRQIQRVDLRQKELATLHIRDLENLHLLFANHAPRNGATAKPLPFLLRYMTPWQQVSGLQTSQFLRTDNGTIEDFWEIIAQSHSP